MIPNDVSLNVAALISTSKALLATRTRWDDVRKIVLSPKRYQQLLAAAVPDTERSVLTFAAGVDLEVSSLCDDRVGVLVGASSTPLGLFSFETGETRWFDQKLMRRWTEPTFNFPGEN